MAGCDKLNWRDTARPLRFFIFDARVLIGFLVWALHACMETFYIALGLTVLFSILEFFGLRPVPALRIIKNFWASDIRPSLNYFDIRRRARW